jgi:hypothetical protein
MFKQSKTSKIQSVTNPQEKAKGAKMAKKEANGTPAVSSESASDKQSTPPTATGSSDLVQIQQFDMTLLQTACTDAKEGLAKLLDLMPTPELKQIVVGLNDLANPHKLGVSDELEVRWTVPRLQLCQPTTTAVEKPASAKPGDLFTKNGELLASPYEVTPLFIYESNVKFKKGQNAPDCAAPDAKLGSPYGLCAKCKFLPMGKQPVPRDKQERTDCNNQINVIVIDSKFEKLYEISFAKTSRAAGSSLKNMAGRGKYAWEKSFLLSSEKKTGDEGTYYIFKIEPTGKVINGEKVVHGESYEKIARALYFYIAANRKLFLADHYQRIALGGSAAARNEEKSDVDSELMSGLTSDADGEEPIDEPAKNGSVRGGSAPM